VVAVILLEAMVVVILLEALVALFLFYGHSDFIPNKKPWWLFFLFNGFSSFIPVYWP
jgi:hypothetical protein